MTKAFVTFPEYMWAKNAGKKLRYLHQKSWKIGTQLKKV